MEINKTISGIIDENIGSKVAVFTPAGMALEGTIVSSNDDSVTLSFKTPADRSTFGAGDDLHRTLLIHTTIAKELVCRIDIMAPRTPTPS